MTTVLAYSDGKFNLHWLKTNNTLTYSDGELDQYILMSSTRVQASYFGQTGNFGQFRYRTLFKWTHLLEK